MSDAASQITRTTWTDDDGSNTLGTILNNAELQKIYDAIDLNNAGTTSYPSFVFGKGVGLVGQPSSSAPAASPSGGAREYYDTTWNAVMRSINGGSYQPAMRMVNALLATEVFE